MVAPAVTTVAASTKPLDVVLLPGALPVLVPNPNPKVKPVPITPQIPAIVIVPIPAPVNMTITVALSPVIILPACLPLPIPSPTPVDIVSQALGPLVLVWMFSNIEACIGGGALGIIDDLLSDGDTVIKHEYEEDGEDKVIEETVTKDIKEDLKKDLEITKKKILFAQKLFDDNDGKFPSEIRSDDEDLQDMVDYASVLKSAMDKNLVEELKKIPVIIPPTLPLPPTLPPPPLTDIQRVVSRLRVVNKPELTSRVQAEVLRRIAISGRIFTSDEILDLGEQVLIELRREQFNR